MISKDNILKLEIRQELYSFINKNPGLHVREISRKIKIPLGTVRHHLNYLKKLEIIEEKNYKNKKQIFITGKVSKEDKELLALFRKKIPCQIYIHLMYRFIFTRKDLSKELEVDPGTISYYLKKMIKMGIIEEAPAENGNIFLCPPTKHNELIERRVVGREIFYKKNFSINNIHKRIYKLLITHKNNMGDKKFIELYNEFFENLDKIDAIGDKVNRRRKTIIRDGKKISYEIILNDFEILDEVMNFFKPPFCA